MSEQEAFEQAITKHIVSNKLKAFALEKLPNGTYKNNFTKAKLDGWQYATAEANKRIEALEGEVAELKEQLSILKPNPLCDTSCLLSCSMEADYAEKQYLENQQLQANNHDLREALEEVKKWFDSNIELAQSDEYGNLEPADSYSYECYQFVCFINQALSAPPAESLQAHDDEVIEKCAKVCDEWSGGYDFAKEIRALKEVK